MPVQASDSYPVISQGIDSEPLGRARFKPMMKQLVIDLSDRAWHELSAGTELEYLHLGWAAAVPQEGEVEMSQNEARMGLNTQDALKAVQKGSPMDFRTLSNDEIFSRFGYHAGTTAVSAERPELATIPRHQLVRQRFIAMAMFLDEVLPPGRAKNVMFTELENAEMWANKAIAEMAPVVMEVPEGLGG